MNRVEAIEFAKEQQEIFGGRMGEFLKFVEDELVQTTASNTLNALDSVDLISKQAAIDAVLKGKVDEDESLVECPAECNAMIDGAVEDIKALPSAPRWIPVTERLPKEEKDVLCFTIHHTMLVASYGKLYPLSDEVGWITNEYNRLHVSSVTAWMPLPEPYKE